MSNGENVNKTSRIGTAVEESCKVIRSSLDVLVQQYKVKRLIDGEEDLPRSVNHIQEKIDFLEEIGYINPQQKKDIHDFFGRFESISLKLKNTPVNTELKNISLSDNDPQISNLDQAITRYFRDYTKLAILLINLKVNAF